MFRNLFCLLFLLAGLTFARAADGARLAYIISLENYVTPAGIIERKNSKTLVAKTMRKIGFTVQHYDDLTGSDLRKALIEISLDSKNAEAAIIYVNGFVLGQDNRGGLLPINALEGGTKELIDAAIHPQTLLETPRARAMNLVIIDGAEDAAAALKLHNPGTWLPYLTIPPKAPKNTVGVIVSSAPTEAYNRLEPAKNPAYYARSFSDFFGNRDRTVADFLSKVSISVFYESQYTQFPVVFGKLDKPYRISRRDEVSDITAWLELQMKPKAEEFRKFIETYPDSIYIDFARQKLKELE